MYGVSVEGMRRCVGVWIEVRVDVGRGMECVGPGVGKCVGEVR